MMLNKKQINAFATICFALLLLALLPGASLAAEAEVNEGEALIPEFDLFFQTFGLFANDRDFDRSRPVYSNNGQTTGYVSTTFRPGLTWRPLDNITIRYQLEIGENVWSRNDLDQRDMDDPGTAVVRHKEVWAEVLMPDGNLGLKSGYMYFHDPTHLVLDRHMGAFQFLYNWDGGRLRLAAGQVPDDVYEGNDEAADGSRLTHNNFEHDEYVFALWADLLGGGGWRVSPGAFFRWDKTEIKRPKGVFSPLINLHAPVGDKATLELDLVGQWGKYVNGGLDNRDVEYVAGAAQLGVDLDLRPVGLAYNFLAFTADDGNKYDLYDTGFHYSGWSKSRTMIMSQNWLQDQYTNLDERIAAQGAGLFLFDQDLSLALGPSVSLLTILGLGMTFDDTHTGGESYLGTEGHLGVEWAPYQDHVTFILMGGGMVPGKAASMLKNEIDREATDNVVQVQASMTLDF